MVEIRKSVIVLCIAVLAIILFTGCPPSGEQPADDGNGGNGVTENGNGDTGNGDTGITEEPIEGTEEEPMEGTEEEPMEEPVEEPVIGTGAGGDTSTSGYMAAYKGAGAAQVGSESCLMCHSDRKPGDSVSHVSVLEADANGCEKCHGPGGNHNGDKAGILDLTQMPIDDVVSLCTQCHATKGKFAVTDFRASTHYGNEVSCVVCHGGHAETESFLKDPVSNNLCGTCHAGQLAGLADGSHGMENGVCTTCHNPHQKM